MKGVAESRSTILVADDEPTNLQVLRYTLQADYRLLFAKTGEKALELVRLECPDLILLDVMMPGMSGYEVCERLKGDPKTSSIPVIFITALADQNYEHQGLEVGAVDYITKPFNPHIVKARIRTHLSLVRVEELQASRLQIVRRLGAAAEFKDNDTGMHIIRMSHYAKALALALGYSEAAADELLHAAPLHDIGKIGIPDAILQKPGKLNPDEWVVMQQHTVMGAKIIGDHESGLLKTASLIALNHHEKWDGSGYPSGLARDEIPTAAQIVALVDVFDALTSARPYKPAWKAEDAIHYIQQEAGIHFDPELVRAFQHVVPEILLLQKQLADKRSESNNVWSSDLSRFN